MVKFIKKRDNKIDKFDSQRLRNAILKATKSVGYGEEVAENIFNIVLKKIELKYEKTIPEIDDIEEIILITFEENGYQGIAKSYRNYKEKRAEARRILSIATVTNSGNPTDKALLIESDSKEVIGGWEREKVANQLIEEAGISVDLAKELSKMVENIVVDMYLRGVRKLSTTDIRSIVDLILKQEGLEASRKKQALLGFPASDFESIIFSKSMENSNVASNNPEALNLEIAERIEKQYALENIFSESVSNAHMKGRIHVHDLGYPARVYCSSHSLEYIKKYGLNKILSNLESKSSPPNSAYVLNQHVQTFLASLQANYAGALGFGFLNILYAPLLERPIEVVKFKYGEKELELELRDFEKFLEQGVLKNQDVELLSTKLELRKISKREILQIAQNLIFAASQNAFSRGGQTLFIDFNIHTGVPHYLKNVPAIGPKGKYMILMEDKSVIFADTVPRYHNEKDKDDPRNGDADSSQLKRGKILTYGDFEETAQDFCYALLEVWKRGDKEGRPFHFPKCDLHVDETSFNDKNQIKLLDFAFQVSSENGAVYFMFDRGEDAVLAQCCRLKEKIESVEMLKHPEKLRFTGFQNVTINLAHASYLGTDLKGTLSEIDKSMELALNAHFQKKEFIQKLLDTDGSPMRGLGVASDDGSPYIDLKKATYIIGVIGLNEAVQVISGKQLHESEDAYRLGLEIIAHMYKKIKEFKARTGLKFTLEETPAESATRRLAKVDLKQFEKAKGIVKGKGENVYYSNSIHFAPDAKINLVDRIVGQSKFHELIESGAIIHAYIGEKRPDYNSIKHIVRKTLFDTRCSQLVFSPTFTECDSCGNIMIGDKELCSNNLCTNSKQSTVNKNTLFAVTRIVGYYSRLSHWNGSQLQIYQARKDVEEYYAGLKGENLNWLHNPAGNGKLVLIEFGKKQCPNCKVLKEQIEEEIEKLKLKDKVDFKVNYLDEYDRKALTEAAVYSVPFDSVPTLVIAGKSGFWKKTAIYPKNCSSGACGVNSNGKIEIIKPEEVEIEINSRIEDFDFS